MFPFKVEAYTLSMLMLDFFNNFRMAWELGPLGTNISEWVLQVAIEGCYSREDVEHMGRSNRFFKYVQPSVYKMLG